MDGWTLALISNINSLLTFIGTITQTNQALKIPMKDLKNGLHWTTILAKN